MTQRVHSQPSLARASFDFDNRVPHGVLLGELGDDVLDGNDRQRRQRSRMTLPVANQSRLLRESLAANVANVRPLARVYENVLLLGGLPPERLAANGTRERLHTRVHSHVRVQVPAAEPLAAGRAQHLLPGLVPGQMLLEILLSGHPSPADPAHELRLVVPVLHVSLQRVKILAEMAANVAHYRRRVAVILLHVMVERFLDLELFAARVAGEVVAGRVQANVVVLQRAFVVALVLANAAVVHLTPMDLLDVGGQVSAKPERLRTVGAPVPVFLQMLGQVALLQELSSTVVALQVTGYALLSRRLLVATVAKGLRFCFLFHDRHDLEVFLADPALVLLGEIQLQLFDLQLAERVQESKTENQADRVIVGLGRET